MIDYDSLRATTLRTFFFAFHAGAKELKTGLAHNCNSQRFHNALFVHLMKCMAA